MTYLDVAVEEWKRLRPRANGVRMALLGPVIAPSLSKVIPAGEEDDYRMTIRLLLEAANDIDARVIRRVVQAQRERN